jgi:hypothetical protein
MPAASKLLGMKWHDDLSKWQERLGQVGGLLSVGAGFVLSPSEPEQARNEEPEMSTGDAAHPPEPDTEG